LKIFFRVFVVAICLGSASISQAQDQTAAPTDVYHVMFVKAAPGQAAALATQLQETDPKNPMASHFVLLRHLEGDDWDYCVIAHLGPKATVEITPLPAIAATPTRVWHDDSFAAGPSWAEFQRSMGLTEQSSNMVYVVSTHRAVPGHRDQLLKLLSPDPKAKVGGTALLTHIEGGRWQFLVVQRHNSWQDLGADRTAAASGGWLEARQHSADHMDTIADRVR
jgi:hypothetical protein